MCWKWYRLLKLQFQASNSRLPRHNNGYHSRLCSHPHHFWKKMDWITTTSNRCFFWIKWQLLYIVKLLFNSNASVLLVCSHINPKRASSLITNWFENVGFTSNFSRAYWAKRCRFWASRAVSVIVQAVFSTLSFLKIIFIVCYL